PSLIGSNGAWFDERQLPLDSHISCWSRTATLIWYEVAKRRSGPDTDAQANDRRLPAALVRVSTVACSVRSFAVVGSFFSSRFCSTRLDLHAAGLIADTHALTTCGAVNSYIPIVSCFFTCPRNGSSMGQPASGPACATTSIGSLNSTNGKSVGFW